MASVRSRENTFRVDFTNFPKRPSFEDIHKFVHGPVGLSIEQVKRLQMNHAQNCAQIKCCDLKTAQDAVDQHNERHELEINKTKIKVRLLMDDGGVEIKIHDLSENVRNEEIAAYLKHFGDVLSIKELVWGDSFVYKGVPSGVRIAKVVLRRHIKSFVTIEGEQTLVTYRNQPQTCRHCTTLSHPGSSCVENKKLLGQKADLNNRLKAAQSDTQSYANILSGNEIVAPLMPNFAPTNLNQLNERTRLAKSTPAADRAETSDHRSEAAPPPVSKQTTPPIAVFNADPAAEERMDEGEIGNNNTTNATAGVDDTAAARDKPAQDQSTQQA